MGIELRTGTGSRQAARSLPQGILLRILGTGLLLATAGLHLDLYLTGYRSIPVIGWLFLLQFITALALGLLILVFGSRLAAAAGAVFALATLGGYLLSVQFGLFGFREVRTTAGIVAGAIEVAAFAVLAVYAAGLAGGSARAGVTSRIWPERGLTLGLRPAVVCAGIVGVSVLALGMMGGALAGAGLSGQTASAAGGQLRTARIGGVTVLTNAAGRTLYWFGPDTPTKSVCNGTCAQYWLPVAGPLAAGVGVPGHLGTIRRTDGSVQETYNGHPLYTYIGDTGPGQAHGNGLDLNGGLWHEVLASG